MSQRRTTGSRVLAARQEKGLTLRRAARRLGVSPRALRGWERGRDSIPYAVRLAMVGLYGVARQDLVPDRPAAGARDALNGTIRIGSVTFTVRPRRRRLAAGLPVRRAGRTRAGGGRRDGRTGQRRGPAGRAARRLGGRDRAQPPAPARARREAGRRAGPVDVPPDGRRRRAGHGSCRRRDRGRGAPGQPSAGQRGGDQRERPGRRAPSTRTGPRSATPRCSIATRSPATARSRSAAGSRRRRAGCQASSWLRSQARKKGLARCHCRPWRRTISCSVNAFRAVVTALALATNTASRNPLA